MQLFKNSIKRRLQIIPSSKLLSTVKALASTSAELQQGEASSLWKVFESEFTRRLQMLNLAEIAELLYNFALANRYNQSFFKSIEDEMLTREFDCLPHFQIGKML